MANGDGEIAEENKDLKRHLNQTCIYVGDGSLQAQDQGLDKSDKRTSQIDCPSF